MTFGPLHLKEMTQTPVPSAERPAPIIVTKKVSTTKDISLDYSRTSIIIKQDK